MKTNLLFPCIINYKSLSAARMGENTLHSFNGTILWTQAICFQGSRVLNEHSKHDRLDTISSLSRIEEQFFLNACEKAVRWSKALSSEGKDTEIRKLLPTNAIREFIKSMDSTYIRNMREHEEEYLRTNGKSLEGEMIDASIDKESLTLLVEPGITILRNGDVIIGGQVSVRDSIEIAQRFNVFLIDAQHKFVRSKYSLLKNANPEDYPHLFAPREIIQ